MDFKRLKFVDRTFVAILIIIVIFGLVILSSATRGISSDPYFYLKKQVTIVLGGIFFTILIMRFDYLQFKRYSIVLYVSSLLLLILVLVFGQEVRGTTGWIPIGPLPPLQPAEFTKVFLVLSFADFVSRRRGNLNTLGEMMPCFIYMGIPFILIMLQPDLGTAVVYIAITFIMMFFSGANYKVLLKIILLVVVSLTLVLVLHFKFNMPLPLKDYQLNRLTVFVNPYNDGEGGRGPGWNTIQSLIAIGSGGFWGKGLFKGTQVQLNFLPEHHTDFIYAVIGEELGFIGAVFVIILYGILIMKAINIAYNSRELYGSLMVLGITSIWLFHVFENIGMSIGMLPITGIPLPFLSYGGSSMLSNLIAAALILSVNLRGNKLVF